MPETKFSPQLEEIERLLNDPDVPMQAARIWSLMEEVADRVPVPA